MKQDNEKKQQITESVKTASMMLLTNLLILFKKGLKTQIHS